MFKIFLISLVFYCSTAYGKSTFRSDYKYYEDVNGWVKLHKIPADWQDARLRCHDEGATLASPSNSNLRDTMLSVMVTHMHLPSPGIYSGIHSTFSNGSYSTIEGVPVSNVAANWITGQPDNIYTENCVVFHTNGTLEDVQCSNTYEFICYKKYEDLTTNKCGTVDNKYKFDDRTRHCYKFHYHGQTWSQAYKTCIAEGGYLAIINSDAESQLLKELFAQHPKEKIFATHKDSASIGFIEWPYERFWYTIHGQTLEEEGFEKWHEGEPNNLFYDGEFENCGAVWRSGLLVDVGCSQIISFICEKDSIAI